MRHPGRESYPRGRALTLAALACGAALLVAARCAVPAVPPARAGRGADEASGVKEVILATTTSTQDTGLLEVLLPRFDQQTGYRVKAISVGTGAALALGARGEADVVLVHAPEAERQWMAEGNGVERLLVMHNDFVILGPPADPAGINGERSAIGALTRLAAQRATWVSRDDRSGTDQLEKRLWQAAGLSPAGQSWYVTAGQGMGATLTLADQKDAYTLSDRATYLARRRTLRSQILVEGDAQLLNVYHVMPVNPAKFPNARINAAGGRAFAAFLVAPETQQLIADFGRSAYGQALFVPDAGKREDQLSQRSE